MQETAKSKKTIQMRRCFIDAKRGRYVFKYKKIK